MKLFKIVGLGLGGIIAVAAIFLALWDRPSLADYEIVMRDDYEIIRDNWGVPTIRGESDPAVAYGVALAHADDDFETLQTKLLAVRGRLGSVAGAEGAKADALSAILRVDDVVAAGYDKQLSARARAFVEAYADGINRFAAENKDEILRNDLFPVTGRDVIAGFVYTAPLFFGADEVIGALAAGDAPPVALRDSLPRGSNAFAIAPHRSADGKTRLYSNAHQPWAGPVAWYEVRVESGEGWRMNGANFPGGPLPFLGHNDHLGWTNTVNLPDIIDVYKLTVKAKRYKFGDEWRDLEKKRVWLRVKAGPFMLPVPKMFYWSVHGPAFKTKDGWYAARWPGMNDVHHMDSYLALARSKNYDEFLDALRIQAIPAFNFVYADKHGNIAHIYNASFPDRSPDYDWNGVLPGDDPKALWTEIVPFDDYPRLENPPSGYLVNANNTPFIATAPADNLNPDDFSETLGIETRMTNRIIRAVDLLEEIPSISREELDRVKFDVAYDPRSRIGGQMAILAAIESDDDLTGRAAALLRSWDWEQDGEGAADGLACILLNRLFRANYRKEPLPPFDVLLGEAAEHMMTHFDALDAPLSEVSRIRRGDVDVPVTGGPDALRAIGAFSFADDGRMVSQFGDSFIMLVEWDENGRAQSWTAQPYGAAVDNPSSPHHSDQVQMFADGKMKPSGYQAPE